MIKSNSGSSKELRALRKNNASAIIILTPSTVVHSSVLSCREPGLTLCESRGRLCMWCVSGVGLWKILEFFIDGIIKARACVY